MSQKNYDLTDIDKMEINSEKLGDVYFKPKIMPYILIACGIPFVLFKSLSGYVMAAIFFLIGIILIFIKDWKILTVYKDCVVVYDKDQIQGVKLDNEDIAEWNVNLRDNNQVYIRLNNGLGLTRASFNLGKCSKWMNETMPEKSTQSIRKEKGEDNIFKRMVIARQKAKKARQAKKNAK